MKSLLKHHSRRWWLVVGGVALFVVLTVSYVFYSAYSWQTYQQRFATWQQSTKARLYTNFALKASSETERLEKIAKLKAVTASIRREQATICTPSRLTGWQRAIQNVDDTFETCQAYAHKVGLVTDHLTNLTAYLEDEYAAGKLLKTVAALPTSVEEKSWDQTATAWSQVNSSLSSLTVSTAFLATKQQMIGTTTSIDAAWKELMAAHVAKDKARFVKAVTQLNNQYKTLEEVNKTNSSQLTSLTEQLQQAYARL